jgi:hypothetical protein
VTDVTCAVPPGTNRATAHNAFRPPVCSSVRECVRRQFTAFVVNSDLGTRIYFFHVVNVMFLLR